MLTLSTRGKFLQHLRHTNTKCHVSCRLSSFRKDAIRCTTDTSVRMKIDPLDGKTKHDQSDDRALVLVPEVFYFEGLEAQCLNCQFPPQMSRNEPIVDLLTVFCTLM